MALFVSIRILPYLLLLLTITQIIHSYRLHTQEQLNDKNEYLQIENNQQHIHRRSVLWPKICFRTRKERNNRRYVRDQTDRLGNNHYFWHRPTRKCYPFDMR
jgi:hypothetical protein